MKRHKKWARWVLALVVVTLLTTGGLATWVAVYDVDSDIDTVGKVDFNRSLAIPPLAESTVDSTGTRVFNLEMQAGVTDLGRDDTTPTWGFNSAYLGPTLRASRGERVLVNVHHSLSETSTVHWHGMHLPAAMDGGPHQPIASGESIAPTWTIDQPAATLWYHPHPQGQTSRHVYRGLAGMLILDDARSSRSPMASSVGRCNTPTDVRCCACGRRRN